jgi:hypothetical protein
VMWIKACGRVWFPAIVADIPYHNGKSCAALQLYGEAVAELRGSTRCAPGGPGSRAAMCADGSGASEFSAPAVATRKVHARPKLSDRVSTT